MVDVATETLSSSATDSSVKRCCIEDVPGRADCGQKLFKKGDRTDSSISSYVFEMERSRVAGEGGSTSFFNCITGLRTSYGRLTAREPFGAMYASIRRSHNPCTYSRSFAGGRSELTARESIFV
jgi:hypothetical protein